MVESSGMEDVIPVIDPQIQALVQEAITNSTPRQTSPNTIMKVTMEVSKIMQLYFTQLEQKFITQLQKLQLEIEHLKKTNHPIIKNEMNPTEPTNPVSTQVPNRQMPIAAQPKKRKTYKQALFGKNDTVQIVPMEKIQGACQQLIQSTTTSSTQPEFVKQKKPQQPAKNIQVAAFWIIDTPDPDKVSFKTWRQKLRELGAPERSILELRHPLRNVVEVITTTEHQEEVMKAAIQLNNRIRAPSPYTRVWEAPTPLTAQQIVRMSKSYYKGVARSPIQAVRIYLEQVAQSAIKLLIEHPTEAEELSKFYQKE